MIWSVANGKGKGNLEEKRWTEAGRRKRSKFKFGEPVPRPCNLGICRPWRATHRVKMSSAFSSSKRFGSTTTQCDRNISQTFCTLLRIPYTLAYLLIFLRAVFSARCPTSILSRPGGSWSRLVEWSPSALDLLRANLQPSLR